MRLYADGADIEQIRLFDKDDRIAGFTTNPSLIKKAGVTDYAAFCEQAAKATTKPISFEVISDDFTEMEMQAHRLAAMGGNVFVKIPVTNTRGDSSCALIKRLSGAGIKVNVTAVLSPRQVFQVANVLRDGIISIFAGRIADAGLNPQPICEMAKKRCHKSVQVLWASTRELINIKQADGCRCDIITVPNDMLAKLHLFGKDLDEYSRETVQMFYNDAVASGFVL